MTTERHNIACRMILKAIKITGSLGSCIVSMDIGSNERMTMQNLQIPEAAESKIVPKWLFPPASQIKTNLPPAAQIYIVLITIYCADYSNLCKNTKTTLLQVGGWVLRSGRGQQRETGSILAATPATNPRQHRPKDLSKPRRDIHLVEIKYCEDTRPQNQLAERRKGTAQRH